MFSWPGPSPDRGCKAADETKSRRSALQRRMGLLVVLQICIKGQKKIFVIKLRYQKNLPPQAACTALAQVPNRQLQHQGCTDAKTVPKSSI